MWLIKPIHKKNQKILLFIKSDLDFSSTILGVKQDKGKVSQFFILKLLKMFMSVTLNANDTFTIFLLDNILGLFSECILISVVPKVSQISYCLIREANFDLWKWFII